MVCSDDGRGDGDDDSYVENNSEMKRLVSDIKKSDC